VSAVAGHVFGKRLCRLFKLDPAKVRCMRFNVDPDEIVTLTIERVVAADEADDLGSLLEEYDLHKREEPEA